ncbi:hypothetical protein [Kaistia defluvii]|uniref:Uncharacterized protein n=1 Tax=Kaistia defluvii TaxID=410841 RepID=A0ABV2QWR9_9HYPH
MSQRGYGGPLRYVQGPGVIADIGRYVAPPGDSALAIVDGFFWDSLRPTDHYSEPDGGQ